MTAATVVDVQQLHPLHCAEAEYRGALALWKNPGDLIGIALVDPAQAGEMLTLAENEADDVVALFAYLERKGKAKLLPIPAAPPTPKNGVR